MHPSQRNMCRHVSVGNPPDFPAKVNFLLSPAGYQEDDGHSGLRFQVSFFNLCVVWKSRFFPNENVKNINAVPDCLFCILDGSEDQIGQRGCPMARDSSLRRIRRFLRWEIVPGKPNLLGYEDRDFLVTGGGGGDRFAEKVSAKKKGNKIMKNITVKKLNFDCPHRQNREDISA